MIHWKALLAGVATIIVLGLLAQMIFLFFVTGLTILLKSHPLYTEYGRAISLAFGVPLFFLVMGIGGYVTAHYSREKVIVYGAVVGAIATGFSLVPSLMTGKLVLAGVLFLLAGVVFTALGSLMWQRRNGIDTSTSSN